MSKKLIVFAIALALVMGQLVLAQTPLEQDSGPDGIVSVEAENFDENVAVGGHGWEETGPTGGFTGVAGMWSPNGNGGHNTNYATNSERLDYEINFVKSGTHYIWILGWGASGTDDSCHVGLDGEATPLSDRMSGWNNNYRWANGRFQRPERSQIDVREAGIHTLNVFVREDGLIIDKIVLTTNPDYTPTGEGPPESPRGAKVKAGDASPSNDVSDVPWYIDELNWSAGNFAKTHNVYFGTNFDDVNDRSASALVGDGLTDASQAIQTDLETTYYWAVDEVNGAPDFTVHAGDTWNFTVESVANLVTNVTATADSQFNVDTGPENTVNGSGLTDGQHSTEADAMWQSAALPATIEFVFDDVYVLHEMRVWNQNQLIETLLGFGAKDVVLEVSADGTDFVVVEGLGPFSQAPGAAGYAANTIVAFDGTPGKAVRLTIMSNFGPLQNVGLSEVQFTAIPAFPREFSPANGDETDGLDVILSWRAGRFAAEHQVLLSQDQAAVADGSAVIATTADKSHALSGLEYGNVYFNQIIDVAADGSTYPGPIIQFYTPAIAAIDDMESYKDEEFFEIWATWVDGFDDSANGSLVGGIAGIPETGQVYEGKQSLPLEYDLTTASVAEATQTFSPALDLTAGAPDNLGIFFQGDPNNGAASVYLTVTDSAGQSIKVSHPDRAATNLTAWTLLSIPFVDMGSLNLSSIRSITFGVEDSGAAGTVFADYLHVSIASPSPEAVLSGLSNIGASSDDVVTWFEAESGAITAPMQVFSDSPPASAGQHIGTEDGIGNENSNPPADGIATYSFNVPEDGVYRLAFRVIITGGSDSFWVRISGMVTNTVNHASGWVRFNGIEPGGLWHWDEVHSWEPDESFQVVDFTLSAGTHTLDIARREDGALLDAIAVLK